MPQLDVNAFMVQYTGLVMLILVVYALLAYGILPLLFRTLWIRSWITSLEKAGDVSKKHLPPTPYALTAPQMNVDISSRISTALTKAYYNNNVAITQGNPLRGAASETRFINTGYVPYSPVVSSVYMILINVVVRF